MIPDLVANQIPELVPELGHLALIIALAFAICLSIIPLIGVHSQQQTSLARLVSYAKPLSYGLFFLHQYKSHYSCLQFCS
jgi:cytochrome c-type biogenesis protein CcmF